MSVDLSQFRNGWYRPGRGRLMRLAWYFANAIFLLSPLNPLSCVKVRILRLFGAEIGINVTLKPGINVKYPWNLSIGDHSSVGENVWLDSLAPIILAESVCISQGAYLCTGNHDWSDPAFGLIVQPISVEKGAWLGARSVVLPGVTIKSHSVVAAGAVVAKDTEPYLIYVGNPAYAVKERVIAVDDGGTG